MTEIPEEIRKMFPDQPIHKMDIVDGELHILASSEPLSNEPDFEHMPIEQVNQYLRDHGYDPEQVEIRGKILTDALIENIKLTADLAAALKRAEAAEEDADTLAELLNASLDNGEPITAPEDVEIEALCLRLGFGAVLSSAARLWARRDDTGAFTLGHCRAIVGSALANHEIAKGGEG